MQYKHLFNYISIYPSLYLHLFTYQSLLLYLSLYVHYEKNRDLEIDSFLVNLR